MEIIENDKEWRSCCTIMDKEAVMFFSQLGIAITTIAFSITMLALSDSCERDSLYSGILTLVVGVYLPQLQMKIK
jgi:hypothetical protein